MVRGCRSEGVDQPQGKAQLVAERQRTGRLRDEYRLPAGEIEQHERPAEFVPAHCKQHRAGYPSIARQFGGQVVVGPGGKGLLTEALSDPQHGWLVLHSDASQLADGIAVQHDIDALHRHQRSGVRAFGGQFLEQDADQRLPLRIVEQRHRLPVALQCGRAGRFIRGHIDDGVEVAVPLGIQAVHRPVCREECLVLPEAVLQDQFPGLVVRAVRRTVRQSFGHDRRRCGGWLRGAAAQTQSKHGQQARPGRQGKVEGGPAKSLHTAMIHEPHRTGKPLFRAQDAKQNVPAPALHPVYHGYPATKFLPAFP
jgi:hypothetical protein